MITAKEAAANTLKNKEDQAGCYKDYLNHVSVQIARASADGKTFITLSVPWIYLDRLEEDLTDYEIQSTGNNQDPYEYRVYWECALMVAMQEEGARDESTIPGVD